MVTSDIPPSYNDSIATPPTKVVPVKDPNVYESEYRDDDDAQVQADQVPLMQPGPSYVPVAGQVAMMHHYVNPLTGEHIVSPLPPSHPEMICLQEGTHVKRTKFGLLGVLAAIFWFPLGVGLCLLDRRVTCDRCGRTIEDGILCG